MLLCTSCNKQYDNEVKFCSECGNKVQQVEIQANAESAAKMEEPVVVNSNSKQSSLKKIIIAIVCVILVVLCSYYGYSNYMTNEGKAKNVVNHYLKAIKTGDSTYDYKKSGVNDSNNVLDYKFLGVKDESKEDNQLIINQEMYDMFYKDKFKSFDDWKADVKKEFTQNGARVLSEDVKQMTLLTGRKHDKLTLLYDVNVTNGFGQGVYKKAYFVVENDNSNGEFKVSSIEY
ncbi:hypothetical protein ACFQZT_12680 [Paenibacillus sp. GCM10027628]|uniref:hypothetical protein n=1 Tax=Paenibacillus sp. GCM10027628 TaxID=3273413 RepID=UPI00363445C4